LSKGQRKMKRRDLGEAGKKRVKNGPRTTRGGGETGRSILRIQHQGGETID